ncbi:Uncharacterised protein [Mycoplasmopsis synoviae]|uniref:Uncharacterized protein n=1 Tax=Mycoplasmopsis synoviae TaxID=2109 RepID=A0A3B0PHH3_MYCSY|nr:Uncharacterised protein [Mycoplasmopsis synoviae]
MFNFLNFNEKIKYIIKISFRKVSFKNFQEDFIINIKIDLKTPIAKNAIENPANISKTI